MNKAILKLRNIQKSYDQGDIKTVVLKGASIEVNPGELIGLVGPSGSGKSTLLHIAGLLDTATSGDVVINNRTCAHMNDFQRTRLRNERIGFVYQFHHLLPEFTVKENILMPAKLRKTTGTEAASKADHLMKALGLQERAHHKPSELSGGEKQRAAIARALINDPALLLADEPTGNLDEDNAEIVFRLMVQTIREQQSAAIIATHNMDMARQMDTVFKMANGTVVKA